MVLDQFWTFQATKNIFAILLNMLNRHMSVSEGTHISILSGRQGGAGSFVSVCADSTPSVVLGVTGMVKKDRVGDQALS